ncbi:MAG: hypothetical protein E4G96_07400, partial [Chrysiogenales bacterium]
MTKTCIAFLLAFLPCTPVFASYEDALKLYEAERYQESLKLVADQLVTDDDFKPNSSNYNLRFLAAHNHWKLGN